MSQSVYLSLLNNLTVKKPNTNYPIPKIPQSAHALKDLQFS
ncbi:hypothetical protein GXM_07386 [Nostoc sphaeroides CCNUC1]|uniref:Uncharacterized protein n=1 Tax=Nostoc sphaeroides CCNUC1 TaxID=2653204 RepID=A0A5P8WBC3_9NOSO|nr:hypothetical protein GXM_07386 [Nostoc sphaeroides CCNUC1]